MHPVTLSFPKTIFIYVDNKGYEAVACYAAAYLFEIQDYEEYT